MNNITDKDRLDWLEKFLQLGGSSIFASPTCISHENREDDTPAPTMVIPICNTERVRSGRSRSFKSFKARRCFVTRLSRSRSNGKNSVYSTWLYYL
jgi:hypothetical protein